MPFMPMQKQIIPKTLIHDAILNRHFDMYGSSDQMSPVEDQFKKYVYPVAGLLGNPHDLDRYALLDNLLE